MVSILTGILFGLCIRAGLEAIGNKIKKALEDFCREFSVTMNYENQIKVSGEWLQKLKGRLDLSIKDYMSKEIARQQRAVNERTRRQLKAQAAGKKYTPRKKLTDPVSVAKKK